VEAIAHLNLFLSGLQNWDITEARYVIPSWFREKGDADLEDNIEAFDFASKVNQICNKMRALKLDAERDGQTLGGRSIRQCHFLLPVLSTFAREDPPKLIEALGLIKDNALSQHSVLSRKPPLYSDVAQSSIQSLAFLADYELIFETALGMYDFDISRAVARNSQMDPKVYLPLLKRYASLPQYYCRYEVDIRLKRYESALRNLHRSAFEDESMGSVAAVNLEHQGSVTTTGIGNTFEDCMRLIEEQKQHTLGLQLFQDRGERHQIMLSLSDSLMNEKRPTTALEILFAVRPIDMERANCAARAYRDWRALFSLVSLEERTREASDDLASQKRFMLARDVAEELVYSAEGQFNQRDIMAEGARVLLDYGNDTVGTVDMLTRAEMWSEGQRAGLLHSRNDLARKGVEAAVSYAQTTIGDLEERCETFFTSNTRYAEVLQILKNAIADGEGKPDEFNDNDDNGSLFSAASNASNSSNRSDLSSGSVGSISSVIFVKSTSSFSLAGGADSYRHKSKFNQIGRINKKKKKKNRGRAKPDQEVSKSCKVW